MGLFSWLRGSARVRNTASERQTVSKQQQEHETVSVEPFTFSEAEMSGPFTSGNLAMYLIHGTDTSSTNFITLEEALAKKKVVIEETGQVNSLKIKNASDEVVFIQSGDIVKGGRQDRTLQYDMILNSKSDFESLNSFCVEQSRWHKRGEEADDHFSGSNFYLSSARLRMAAKVGSQNAVWNEVGNLQYRTAQRAGVHISQIQNQTSTTSLQLTLENEKLQEHTDKYVKDLKQAMMEKPYVIGCAFAINGEMNSIDIYASSSLFKKMSAKLLQAAAVEAFTEQREIETFVPPTLNQVMSTMKDLCAQKATVVMVNGDAKIVKQELMTSVLYETRDLTNEGQWLHRNYTAKQPATSTFCRNI
jgi:hypothetical protein